MNIDSNTTDDAVLAEFGKRLARLRLERNLTQSQLACEAGISKPTLQRLESGEVATQLSGFLRVCRALGLLERLDLLLPEPVASPMAQLKQAGRKRQRATGKKAAAAKTKWTWGEPA
jgi:transcriptional regulator with XRE-family HTH domain